MCGPTGGGKKFATNFDFTFSAECLTALDGPPYPRFQCWYFEAREHNFLHWGGEVRLEKSSQPKSMLRSSNIEIWGSGGIIGCRSVCFNSINGVRPHSQSRRLRTFFLLLSGGSVYICIIYRCGNHKYYQKQTASPRHLLKKCRVTFVSGLRLEVGVSHRVLPSDGEKCWRCTKRRRS